MTTSRPTGLLCDSPGELIAAIPGLLGFAPVDSLVLVTYTSPTRLGFQAVLRVDLPKPEQVSEMTNQLRVAVLHQNANLIELVVFGGPADVASLPHRHLVEKLTEAFVGAGVVVAHAVWAPRVESGVAWRCYEDPDCSGEVRDPATSSVNAIAAMAGFVTYGSREELAAQLASEPADALARRATLLVDLPPIDPNSEIRFMRDTIDALAATDNSQPNLDDDTIVRLAHALSHPDVRDMCLAFSLTMRAHAAERLWTLLTRALPEPAVAGSATLLAVCAYLRGEGALAGIAVDKALAAFADHRLAYTVRQIIDHGMPPEEFRLLLTHSVLAAFTNR